jgi:hypothetical protein
MGHLFGEEPIVLLEAPCAAVPAGSRHKATTRIQARSWSAEPGELPCSVFRRCNGALA